MEKVPFDPGIAQFAPCFSQDITYAMQQVLATKSIQQRKFKFQFMYPHIIKSFEKITGFYEGCMMWAYYIKYSNNESEKEITGNNFYEQDVLNDPHFDFLYEINYLIEYFDKFPKDVKFFLNKNVTLDKHWFDIAKTYKEFLQLNDNFVNIKTTKEVLLPKNFTPKKDLNDIKILFDKVITTGQIEAFISSSVN